MQDVDRCGRRRLDIEAVSPFNDVDGPYRVDGSGEAGARHGFCFRESRLTAVSQRESPT